MAHKVFLPKPSSIPGEKTFINPTIVSVNFNEKDTLNFAHQLRQNGFGNFDLMIYFSQFN